MKRVGRVGHTISNKTLLESVTAAMLSTQRSPWADGMLEDLDPAKKDLGKVELGIQGRLGQGTYKGNGKEGSGPVWRRAYLWLHGETICDV